MAIQKLALELEETIRQTRELVKSVNGGLNTLLDKNLTDANARYEATNQIMVGLQAQDRIEQRCTNMIIAIAKMQEISNCFDSKEYADIWEELSLDELSKPEMSGISARMSHGEVDLF